MTNKNQGEGNREADREYREGVKKTVESGSVERKAREAVAVSDEEAERLKQAEKEGRERAKELEPES